MARKKATTSKPAAKRTPAKKAAAAPKKLTKTQFIAALAEKTELEKKQVTSLLDALNEVINEQLNDGAGEITLPGLLKIKKAIKAGRPAGEYRVPGTTEMKYMEAKPESTVVRVRPLKGLKDMVAD